MAKYQKHSKTSKDAAKSIGGVLNAKQEEVLAYLQKCGKRGATDIEMQEALGMNPSTQRPRRIELVEYGLAASSGMTRLTPSGRKAEVWIAAGEVLGVEAEEPAAVEEHETDQGAKALLQRLFDQQRRRRKKW